MQKVIVNFSGKVWINYLEKKKINCDHVQLKINGVIQNDNTEVATHFNDYFLDSVRDLADMIPKSICVYNFNCDESFFKLSHVDEGTVLKVISHLNNSKSKDIFAIDSVFLKEDKEILTPVLTKVINQSINESIFPIALKTAIVKPIHKSEDKLQVSNYRPISILPTISKVFKKKWLQRR